MNEKGTVRRVVLAAVVMLAALAAVALIRQGSRQVTFLVGALTLVLSLGLLVLARVQLGTSFSALPRAKKLVTHGLYRRIPHPMFVFLDLAVLGLIILLRRPWLLVIWAVLVGAHVWASARESKVLERAFEDAYREYRRRTLWWEDRRLDCTGRS